MSLAIAPEFRERVRRDEPLSRHTSWHVGGPAERALMRLQDGRGCGAADRCIRELGTQDVGRQVGVIAP